MSFIRTVARLRLDQNSSADAAHAADGGSRRRSSITLWQNGFLVHELLPGDGAQSWHGSCEHRTGGPVAMPSAGSIT